MPFLEPTNDLAAALTNKGREEMARLILGEVSFHVSAFQVGRDGYLDSNPVKIDPIDPVATALGDPVPDAADRKAFFSVEQPIGPNVVAPVCRLEPTDSDYDHGLGELAIFAEYDRDDVTPANVGTDFMFAIAHFPLMAKTASHTLVWRVIISL